MGPPTRTLSISKIRDLDRRTVEEYGLPSVILMENAGRGVADTVSAVLAAQPKYTQVLVFCGGGNNAGDGFVAARHLVQRGVPVTIYLLNANERFVGDAGTNLNIVRKLGISLRAYENFETDRGTTLRNVPVVIVDAMLGTGFKGELRDPIKRAAAAINEFKISHNAKVTVVAVDIPSGLNGDEGPQGEVAVQADVTVTFVCPKLGFTKPGGRSFVGKIDVVDIGIPAPLLNEAFGKDGT